MGDGPARSLSGTPEDGQRRTEREFIEFLKAQVTQLNEMLSAKETQFNEVLSAKETQLSAKEMQFNEVLSAKEMQFNEMLSAKETQFMARETQFMAKETQFNEMLSAKETQLSTKETQFNEMLSAKETQLEKERNARDAWQEERLALSHKRAVLERERMSALAALGKIDLRRVLESIFPVKDRTKEGIRAFLAGNDMLVERCQAEPKIRAEACDRKTKNVTAESLAIELRRIWDDLHSDAHLQLSVEEWKTCRPEQPVVLRVNGITQARVLLLYHLLDHCGYPVETEGVIPNGMP